MNNNSILILLFTLLIFSCGNKESDEPKQLNTPVSKAEVDTNMVLDAFNSNIKEMVDSQYIFSYVGNLKHNIYAGERPILIGDINGDGKLDALLPFAIELLEDGGDEVDKSQLFYAIFLNKEGKLEWVNSMNRIQPNSDKTVTFNSFNTSFILGEESKSSFDKERKSVAFRWSEADQSLIKVTINTYYWSYEGLKLNGKYALNAAKEEVLTLFSEPDSITTYFRECNAGGGPKKVYHYGTLALEFNEENNLDNDDYNFDKNNDFLISFNTIKLDNRTRYEDIIKLSPDIIKQQPEFEEEEEEAHDKDTKIIYIPLRKFFDFGEYYDRVWIILTFKKGLLVSASIPSANCEI